MNAPHVAGICSTNSKRLFLHLPGYPRQLVHAQGATVRDETGKPYTCWNSSLGAVSLGYSHPVVNDAVRRQLTEGQIFPLPHPLEEEVAALLCDAVGAEQLRFSKNASDSIEAAIRLARFVTGRKYIITNGYAGFHSDQIAATDGKGNGVLRANTSAICRATSEQQVLAYLQTGSIAAVLCEPQLADGMVWDWERIQEQCRQVGALLVFDETLTGFCFGYGSAVPTIRPDLSIWGKKIANGFPLACLAGGRQLMQHFTEEVFFSSTAAAECISLAACKATLGVLQHPATYDHIWDVGRELIEVCRDLSIEIVGLPPRTQIRFPSDAIRDAFLSGMAQRGHLLGRDQFITLSHTSAHVTGFAEAALEVLRELQ